MPTPKRSYRLCGVEDAATNGTCSREQGHEGKHVALTPNGKPAIVAAVWGDEIPTLALNLAKVKFFNELTHLITDARDFLKEAHVEMQRSADRIHNRR